jgi:hypothetical protein
MAVATDYSWAALVAAQLPFPDKPSVRELSNSGRKRKAAKDRADANGAQRFTLETCTIQNWRGRTRTDPVYSPSLILQLRLHFRGLGKLDKLAFLSPGVRCCLDTTRGYRGGDLAYAKLHVNYRLEKPGVLAQRLTDVQMHQMALPVPALADCQRVRQKFLHWAVGCSTYLTNRSDPKNQSSKFPKTFHERRFDHAPERRTREERSAPKRQLIDQWMYDQKNEHLLVRVFVFMCHHVVCVCVCVCVCVWVCAVTYPFIALHSCQRTTPR